LRDDIERRPHRIPKDEEGIIRRLRTEVRLPTHEAAHHLKLIRDGSAEAATEKRADEGGK
jgi:hypothetical protein